MYFCFPFTGQHSLQIRTQIRKLCSHAFPLISIRFVFRLLHTRIIDHLGISALTGKERVNPSTTFYRITTTLAIPLHQMISPSSLTPLHLSLMNSSSEKAYSFTNSILPSTLNQAQFLFPYSDCLYSLRHL